MAVRIRLKRTGTRNKACFRVVVMDHKMSRDGKAIEELGFYDPRNKLEQISLERYDYWVANGATPSETVGDIAARAKNGVVLADRQRPASMSKKAKARIEAEAKAKADAEAAEAKAKADAEAKAREEAEAAAKAAAEAAAAPAEEVPAEEAPAEETPAAEAE